MVFRMSAYFDLVSLDLIFIFISLSSQKASVSFPDFVHLSIEILRLLLFLGCLNTSFYFGFAKMMRCH